MRGRRYRYVNSFHAYLPPVSALPWSLLPDVQPGTGALALPCHVT